MDFNFKQPFYKESELLKIIPIKRSTFYSWQSEWIANGNDPREMGKILILSNPKSKKPLVYWDAKKFLNWVYKYKVNTDPNLITSIILKQCSSTNQRSKEKW